MKKWWEGSDLDIATTIAEVSKYLKNIKLVQNPKDPELIDIHGDAFCEKPGHNCVVKLKMDDDKE